jgi:outer membrane protein TolC
VLLGLALLGVAGPAPAAAQQGSRDLSLQGAVQEALAGNADLQVARMHARMAEAAAGGAKAPLWPQLDFQTGYVRSDDPVFAFGTKLRQKSFSADDLDIDRLNSPGPINNWATVLSARWDILSPTLWASKSVAARQAEAAGWVVARSNELTILRTHALYLDGLRTAARLTAASKAEEAARSTREIFARRVERGLLTEAELLGSEAELASAVASRIGAERAAIDARQTLAVFLGWEPDVLPVLTDTLVASLDASLSAEPGGATGEGFDPARRTDLLAREAEADAARQEHRRANYSWLPEVGAFANWAVYSADPFAHDGDYWTVGVGLRWKVFSGLQRSTESKRTAAAEQVARTRYDEGLRQARAEAQQAERAVDAAGEALLATAAARRAAAAGSDLMRRRFEEGLATATDLLTAESRAAEAERAAIDAAAGLELERASLRFVTTQTPSEDDR